MKLAILDSYRLGVVDGDDVIDVSDALAYHDAEWLFAFVPKMIMNFDRLRPRIESQAASGRRIPLAAAARLPKTAAPSKDGDVPRIEIEQIGGYTVGVEAL